MLQQYFDKDLLLAMYMGEWKKWEKTEILKRFLINLILLLVSQSFNNSLVIFRCLNIHWRRIIILIPVFSRLWKSLIVLLLLVPHNFSQFILQSSSGIQYESSIHSSILQTMQIIYFFILLVPQYFGQFRCPIYIGEESIPHFSILQTMKIIVLLFLVS